MASPRRTGWFLALISRTGWFWRCLAKRLQTREALTCGFANRNLSHRFNMRNESPRSRNQRQKPPSSSHQPTGQHSSQTDAKTNRKQHGAWGGTGSLPYVLLQATGVYAISATTSAVMQERRRLIPNKARSYTLAGRMTEAYSASELAYCGVRYFVEKK